MQTSQHSYLSRLDHLRFYAAALVLLFHWFHRYIPDLRSNHPLVSVIDEGHSGMGLFMVISGFILTLIAGQRELSYWGFIRNRVVRIYPLFTVAVVLQVLIGTYNRHGNYGLPQLIAWLVPFRSDTVPLSPEFVQLWSVWVEFQFYLIFPFLLAFSRRHGLRYILGLLLLLLLLRLLIQLEFGSVRFIAYETLFGRLDQFLVGMAMAWLWQRQSGAEAAPPAISPWWLAAATALLVAGLHLFSRWIGFSSIQHPGWVIWPLVEAGLWALFAWTYLLARNSLPSKGAMWLGRNISSFGMISFSIYVMHNLVQEVAVKLIPAPDPAHPLVEVMLWGAGAVLPLTLVLAALTYMLIEKPFLTYRQPYLHDRLK